MSRPRVRQSAGLTALVGAALSATSCGSSVAVPSAYDVVFVGARVIDPETSLDAVRNIGVADGKIAAVSERALIGHRMIDGHRLVAAPGFIDLHSHAMSYDTSTYQAKDGVTTRLELESGVFPVKPWYDEKAGHELINYGRSVSHLGVRHMLQMGKDADGGSANQRARYASQPIPAETYSRLGPVLEEGLHEGAIGIGSGTQYAPGVTHKEMLEVTRVAGKFHTCVFTHVRYGSLVEPNSTLESIQESIANAAITDACVHVLHINSMAMSDAPLMTQLMREARQRGVDVSTEAYPWDGSVDRIRSVIFEAGWEERWGVQASDLQSMATGKRLTREEFDALRNGTGDDRVIMHMNTEETLTALLQDPLVLVASDAVDIQDQNTHPRSAGTFSRVLGHYVREAKALTLMEAIKKMALMPAQRLESFVPGMKHKGRLQVGADADIVLFDPGTVSSKAAYGDAKQYSEGFQSVMVNGVLVVDGGELVAGVFPGRPVFSKFKE
jgi:Amidohydrolase family